MYFIFKNRKYFSCFLGIIIVFTSINLAFAEPSLDIKGKSAILMDFNTGEILYENNSNEKLPPASITKIMVLLIAMESIEKGVIKLTDEVVVTSNAAGMGGSQVYLEEGEIQTVESLLKAICLRSANDASVALAEHISGSEEIFAKKMNERATQLGMKNTNFKNVSGLPSEDHYTTAYDIALMSRELLKHPKIHEWLTLWMAEMKVGKNKDVVQGLVNTNRLVKEYEGANGVKTGFTNEAGFCLSGSAKRGNLQLISVIMGCETSKLRFEETKRMLDYGFATYDSVTIGKKGDVVGKILLEKGKKNEVNVIFEKDVFVLLPKGSQSNLGREYILPKSLIAPIEKNSKLGELVITLDGKIVDRINLVSSETVESANFADMFKVMFNNLIHK
ncbi:D-alanyl-D-alanine carboxypeptidase family protein [Anaerosalibacter sp. Marseille-P3206]|uniref:D-alanyl-D-alanine carboxypeptidase family protein n=1 Tax=Anaerosalibacter sp. Marseille-P3206 TaxID=1871005 RepID=UPI001F37B618|nr:D-alanyl-D-alanine carboxypeptidase family protein [Anaerosalibacter sp. Marseille-P3206]